MSSFLKLGEKKFLEEGNEYYHVMLDIADLMDNYAKHPFMPDSKEYAARAIQFVLSHQERGTND